MNKILNIPSAIKNSFIKAWKGEEDLWKVFWGWGVLGHLVLFYFILLDDFFIKVGTPTILVKFDTKGVVSLMFIVLSLLQPVYNICYIYIVSAHQIRNKNMTFQLACL